MKKIILAAILVLCSFFGSFTIALYVADEVFPRTNKRLAIETKSAIISGDFLNDTDVKDVVVRASMDTDSSVILAIAQRRDALAWFQNDTYSLVSLKNESDDLQVVQGENATKLSGDSDLWVTAIAGKGLANLAWNPQQNGDWVIVLGNQKDDAKDKSPNAYTVDISYEQLEFRQAKDIFLKLFGFSLVILLIFSLITYFTRDRDFPPKHVKRRTRRFKIFSLIVTSTSILALSLTGCSNNAEQAVPQYPNLTQSQEERIYASLTGVIANAEEKNDAKLLESRVAGAALTVRKLGLKLSGISQIKQHSVLPAATREWIVTNNESFPRIAFVVTNPTENRETERILLMMQESPRAQYKLMAIARSFSDVQFPAFSDNNLGSQQVAADDASTTDKSPIDALTSYAEILQNPESEKVGEFNYDELRKSLAELTESVQSGVETNKGKQSQKFGIDDKQIWAIKTYNGGEFIIGVINSVWTRESGEGRYSRPADKGEEKLFEGKTATSVLEVKYINIVALTIPPKGTGEKIKALGAERIPYEVNAK